MKLAHLILAHTNPKQLERLINRLLHSRADIYIHLDKRANVNDFLYLQTLGRVFFVLKRTAIYWGTYTMVQATLDGMEEIINSKIDYSHINLLSGQDYPLKSAEEIHQFFDRNESKSFMSSKIVGSEWPDGTYRVENYNFGDYRFWGHYYLQYMVNFSKIKKRPIPDFEMLGRSQWVSITPQCAAYVITFLKKNPRIKRFFRMSFAPDEFIFQTVLGNSPFKNTLVNDNLRFMNFPDKSRHPAILTLADALPLTTTHKLYGRKFDAETDSIILNYLDWIAVFGLKEGSREYECLSYILSNNNQLIHH